MRIHLSRWTCLDAEKNLARLREESAEAAGAGADWAIFPESFLNGYTRTVDPRAARQAFAQVSSAHPRTAFFFGSFSEDRRNRMTVWREGREVGRYDKVHLFGPNDEGRLWDAGDRYAAVSLDGVRVGLLNCNDLRFPEQARALKLEAGVTAFVAVAWWPWRRTHVWETLLRARAIENGAWVFGCCVSGSRHPGEDFAGAGNYVFDPHGEPVRTRDDQSYEADLLSVPGLVVDPVKSYADITKVEVFPDFGRSP
jgi:predicted amidohydrolase